IKAVELFDEDKDESEDEIEAELEQTDSTVFEEQTLSNYSVRLPCVAHTLQLPMGTFLGEGCFEDLGDEPMDFDNDDGGELLVQLSAPSPPCSCRFGIDRTNSSLQHASQTREDDSAQIAKLGLESAQGDQLVLSIADFFRRKSESAKNKPKLAEAARLLAWMQQPVEDNEILMFL
ncbi:hypothetical protein Ciccas_009559, partial [Cichlidogyrus casuarinus]